MFSMLLLSNPFLGGSTIIISGTICFLFIKSSNTISTSPAKNSVLSILFIFAFSFASFIASSTISIPYTFFAYFAINNEMVPIPQYKSKTLSFFVIPALSTAILYNFSACIGFT